MRGIGSPAASSLVYCPFQPPYYGALDEDEADGGDCNGMAGEGDLRVNSLKEATVAILERNSALALTLEEVRELLEKDRPGLPIAHEQIIAALGGSGTTVHVVPRPKRRWASAVGPRAWILVPRVPGEHGGGSGIRSKLRSTLGALGRSLEPGSTRGWARWTRMLEEEEELRRALRRRTQHPAVPVRQSRPDEYR